MQPTLLPNDVHLWSMSHQDHKREMRQILSRYLKSDPAIEIDAHGKPFLPEKQLQFNLYHSGACAMLAIALSAQVGVDIECLHRKMDRYLPIAKRFFTQAEYTAITQSTDPYAAFFHCWTRKEAVLKAMGKGISFGLSNIHVSVDENVKLLDIQGFNSVEIQSWRLFDFSSALSGYCMALAVKGCCDSVTLFNKKAPKEGLLLYSRNNA